MPAHVAVLIVAVAISVNRIPYSDIRRTTPSTRGGVETP